MNKGRRNSWLFILSFLLYHTGFSQTHFKYRAKVDSVQTDGFYKIPVSPAVSGLSMQGFSDLRILDDQNAQVPYTIQSEEPSFSSRNFIEFPVISVSKQADKQTHITIRNATGVETDHLLLITRNADASRFVNLSGSDDGNNWYVLKERMLLNNFTGERDTAVQMLSFPMSGYLYFQVTILGRNILPVNVVKAGIYKIKKAEGSHVALPVPVIKQKDSANMSLVRVLFGQVYLIEKLTLLVSGAKYYKRQVSLGEPGSAPASHGVISSNGSNTFETNCRTNELLITIQNGDNPPLQVSEVMAWQLNQSLLAYFKKEHTYYLYFGDSTLTAPRYDLSYFKDSIGNAAITDVAMIEKLSPLATQPPSKTIFSKPFLWGVTAVVVLMLLFLTVRMTKEISNSKT